MRGGGARGMRDYSVKIYKIEGLHTSKRAYALQRGPTWFREGPTYVL